LPWFIVPADRKWYRDAIVARASSVPPSKHWT
jgi:polyphosphate kinase 2 (PPK2 family)